jgi:prepilin-type N-terminal cleavage/methylation domain-containing protein
MRGAKGFTLLEVTVALLILAFILFSLGVLIPLSQVRIRNTSHKDRALMIAEDMIGITRALNWDHIIVPAQYSGTPPFTPPFLDGGGHQIFPPLPYPSIECSFDTADQAGKINTHTIAYTIDVKTEEVPDPDNATVMANDLKKVIITVKWRESTGAGGSALKEITLSSTIYRR